MKVTGFYHYLWVIKVGKAKGVEKKIVVTDTWLYSLFIRLIAPMKKSLKAALLSALVFPGVGHFSLKSHLIGLIFSSTALVGLYFVFVNILEKAQTIVEKIERGEVALDIPSISTMLTEQTSAEAQSMSIAVWVFIIAWLVSIIDSYRLGRAIDNQAKSDNSHSK